MILLTYFLPALLCLGQNVVAAGRRPRFEPLPVCSDCVPREDITAAGIGFDLTTSYATAAIRFHDGSIETLAKVDAYGDYKQMMVRVSDPSSEWECRPGHWSMTCSIESAKRRMNKLLGRPSTPDVGTIASLIQTLLVAAQDKVAPLSIDRALVTILDTPGLTHADLEDAMEHLGLILVSTHKHIPSTVSEVSAAYAGSNMGLCAHYADIDTCEDEEADMSISHILALSLTHHSFSAAYTYMSAAYRSLLEASSTRFDLGLEHLSSGFDSHACDTELDISCPARYWPRIFDVILEIGRKSLRPLTTILLLGEDAGNPDFVRTVQDALRKLLPEASAEEIAAMVHVSGARKVDGDGEVVGEQTASSGEVWDPLYLAARGAAEFAKRAQEAPAGCKEPARCAKNRVLAETEGQSRGLGENEGEMGGQAPLGLETKGGTAELKV